MIEPLRVIDRTSRREEIEKIYGAVALDFLYGDRWFSRLFGVLSVFLLSYSTAFSRFYGFIQKRGLTKKKIVPFIRAFGVDESEFAEPVDSFASFNDFFIRKLKFDARPIAASPAVIPADGRYRFYQDISAVDGFIVKGEKFDLKTLLGDELLAEEYVNGAMVMARLCPSDYHRFHFPCDCTPGPSRLINGSLYSVNPIAVKKNIHIFSQNKRKLSILHSPVFGKVLYLEIGATNVGSIHETYEPHLPRKKGDEKGYFSFGGSSLILLFPPQSIRFDRDLSELSEQHREIKCLMGQSMGSDNT